MLSLQDRMRGFAKSSLDITGKTYIPKGASKKDYVSFGRYVCLFLASAHYAVVDYFAERNHIRLWQTQPRCHLRIVT
jgi:hypothetical protein